MDQQQVNPQGLAHLNTQNEREWPYYELTLVMKHPKTSPSSVSMATKVYRDMHILVSSAVVEAPSRKRLYFNKKFVSAQDMGNSLCNASIRGGVRTWGKHALSFLCVPKMKKGIVSGSIPGLRT